MDCRSVWKGIHRQTNSTWMMNYGYYDIVTRRLKSKKISTENIAEDKAIQFRLNEREKKYLYRNVT